MSNEQQPIISIYEDDDVIRGMYETKLSHSGFIVHAHPDASQALEDAKQEKPHLILMDILMPKVDGHTAIKHLKEDPETQHIPVLVITNFGDDVTIQKALWFGAYDVVVKADNTPQQVVTRVRDALAGKRASHIVNEELIKFLHIDEQAKNQ